MGDQFEVFSQFDKTESNRFVKPAGGHCLTQGTLTPFARVILSGLARRGQFCLDLLIASVARDFLDQVFLNRDVVTPRRNSESELGGVVFAEFKTESRQDAQHLPA